MPDEGVVVVLLIDYERKEGNSNTTELTSFAVTFP